MIKKDATTRPIPQVGDVARMHRQDVRIEIVQVAKEQPDADHGIWTVTDQYGEIHKLENEDGRWFAVVPAL